MGEGGEGAVLVVAARFHGTVLILARRRVVAWEAVPASQ